MTDLTGAVKSPPTPLRGSVVYHKGNVVEIGDDQMARLFWAKIDQQAAGGCWEWNGNRLPEGYGKIRIAGLDLYSHRVSYELHKGKIPAGLHIDHLCRNRSCCNPDHLEAVTGRENIMRSPIAVAAINARKTHCGRGHEFTAENTGHQETGRFCRTCVRANVTAAVSPTVSPGDVPAPKTDIKYGSPARNGAVFSTSSGWAHIITPSDMRRFWGKVDHGGPGGCWRWTAGVDKDGYGAFHLTSQPVKRQGNAHRFAYLALAGTVSDDRILEHLCLNRRCVNPAHLVPVTRRTNEALRLSRLSGEAQR